jgi:NADP-dependent 3-hydroxy acid dehydrogenase YdfG
MQAPIDLAGRRAEALASAAEQMGNAVTTVQGDVFEAADLDALDARVGQAGRSIDVVFVNAGIVAVSLLELASEGFVDNLLAINVKGCAAHRAKGVAADGRRRIGDPDRIDQRQPRPGGHRHLLGH